MEGTEAEKIQKIFSESDPTPSQIEMLAEMAGVILKERYESCEKFVTKTALFTGIFVGVTWLCTELFCEWNEPLYGRSGFQCSSVNPKPFAIVYYAENKKRLVPMDSIRKAEQ